jgi:hypothetical protein
MQCPGQIPRQQYFSVLFRACLVLVGSNRLQAITLYIVSMLLWSLSHLHVDRNAAIRQNTGEGMYVCTRAYNFHECLKVTIVTLVT